MPEATANADYRVSPPHASSPPKGMQAVPGDKRSAGRASQDAETIRACRRIVLLTDGHASPEYSKTAEQMLRYRPEDVVAVLDRDHAGSTAERVFGVGGEIPVVAELASLSNGPEETRPDSLFLAISPSGGGLPEGWRTTIAEAIHRKMHVVSGMHVSLRGDRALSHAAEARGVVVVDIRASGFRQVGQAVGFARSCTRVHTVGTDCSVGKMSAAKEIELGLRQRGRDAAFVATGQTGVMMAGRGMAVDGVVSDFLNGAAENLVLSNQHREIVVVEGQGTLAHPAYSGVTTGLLHGCAPDALVLCHEAGRQCLKSFKHVSVRPLAELRRLYESVGGLRHPCKVIGVALNCRRVTPDDAEREKRRIESELGLPVCDVYHDGPDRLVDAVEELDSRLRQGRGIATREVVTES